MRIISGKFKNRKLFFPKNLKTRPLKDSVKESIFNILDHSKNIDIQIKNSKVLDLYSGSGSFGLESLSREASFVLFLEKDPEAKSNLKKNIEFFNVNKRVEVVEMDILQFFKKNSLKKKFNIIFLDPPYKDENYYEVIKKIREKDFFDKKHIFIVHREKNSDKRLSKYLNIIESRIYGRSEIFFGNFLI